MQIDLTSQKSRAEIEKVRSQIIDQGQLVKFDEFVSSHDKFDFDKEEHVQALKKGGGDNGGGSGCTCNITISPTIGKL